MKKNFEHGLDKTNSAHDTSLKSNIYLNVILRNLWMIYQRKYSLKKKKDRNLRKWKNK